MTQLLATELLTSAHRPARKPPRLWAWLGVGIGLAAAGGVVWVLLWVQHMATAASWWSFGLAAALALWLAFGLWAWRFVRWVARLAFLILWTLACGLAAAALYLSGQTWPAIAALGVWAMTTAFVLGLALLRALLSLSGGPIAVARTVLEEAVRMKIALLFIVLLVLLIPVLPALLDPKELLQYREQFFLSWSIAGVSLMLSLMTVFLACGTVASDLTKRHVFLSLTKPLSRADYLFGKWLGIVTLNLLLLTVAGAGIYTFAKVLERSGTHKDEQDRLAVAQQVLTARVAAPPVTPPGMDTAALFQQRLQQLRSDFPGEYDRPTPQQEQNIRTAVVVSWFTIGPRRAQSYAFTGLTPATHVTDWLQLRLKPQAGQEPPDGLVSLALRVGGEIYRIVRIPPRVVSVIPIPSSRVDASGNLLIDIANLDSDTQPAYGSVSFSLDRGMEILYRVGGFEGNLTRALLVIAIRLAFLAMLGVVAATFLDFSVATLLCLLVFAAASGSGFLEQALLDFVRLPRADLPIWARVANTLGLMWQNLSQGQVWDALKIPIRLVGQTFLLLIPSLGQYSPRSLVSEGRLISWNMLASALFWVGFIWTGATGCIGYFLFARRELARVTV